MNRCAVTYREWRVDANKKTERNPFVHVDTVDVRGLAAEDRGCRIHVVVDNGMTAPTAFQMTPSMAVTLRDALIDVLGHPARGG